MGNGGEPAGLPRGVRESLTPRCMPETRRRLSVIYAHGEKIALFLFT